MKDIKNSFFSTLVFLTRIPVNFKFDYVVSADNMKFFPLVGMIIGAFTIAIAYLSNIVFGSHIAAVLAVLTMVILTGGLHLDGLSDSFDGLFSYRDKEKIIEIMKDSRIGAMGLLAVVFLLILKIAFFELCISSGQIFLLMFSPIMARISLIFICYRAVPMNKSKMGEPFIGKLSKSKYYAIIIFYSIVMAITMYVLYGKIFLGALIFTFFGILLLVMRIRKFVYDKIDGISGDILGATCEIAEMMTIPLIYLGAYLCSLFI